MTLMDEQVQAEQGADEEFDSASEQESQPAPDEVTLRGDTQLAMFDPGGKKPTNATITLRGKTLPVEHGTAFKKGARIRVEAIFVVDDTGDRDKRDKATGLVVDCVHKHSAFVEDVRIIEVVDG